MHCITFFRRLIMAFYANYMTFSLKLCCNLKRNVYAIRGSLRRSKDNSNNFQELNQWSWTHTRDTSWSMAKQIKCNLQIFYVLFLLTNFNNCTLSSITRQPNLILYTKSLERIFKTHLMEKKNRNKGKYQTTPLTNIASI